MTTQASFSSIFSYFKHFVSCLKHRILCYWPNIKRQGHCLDLPAALFLCLPGSVCLTWLSRAPSASSPPPGKKLCLLTPSTFPCSDWQDMAGMYWSQRLGVLLMAAPEGSRRTTVGVPPAHGQHLDLKGICPGLPHPMQNNMQAQIGDACPCQSLTWITRPHNTKWSQSAHPCSSRKDYS